MDGIEVLLLRTREQEYYQMMKELELEFTLEWEHEEYVKLYYLNINEYIALTNKGKVKRKGNFKLDYENGSREIPLGDSSNFLIIPKIINKYLVNNPENHSVEYLLKNWKQLGFSIYDFCASFKVDKSYSVFHNRIKQQQLNRYYASKSKDSAYLIKIKNNDLPKDDNLYSIEIDENNNKHNTISINRWNTLKKNHMLKDSGVMLFNKYVEMDAEEYKINYQFYQSKINDILHKIKNKQDLFSWW